MPKTPPEELSNVQKKARDYLWAGKIRVIDVDLHGDRAPGQNAIVEAQGSGDEPYLVKLIAGVWACSCPAQINECAHVVAAAKVVKWDPLSAPPEFESSMSELLDVFDNAPPAPPPPDDPDVGDTDWWSKGLDV